MAGDSWNERAVAEFVHDVSREAIEIITHRVEDEARETAPVLDVARTRLPGEGWSLPGNLKRSIGSRFDDDVTGQPYGEVIADPVARFTAKKQHAIRDFIHDALDAQIGRSVP